MRVECDLQPNARVELPAAGALRHLPATIKLYHEAHGLRHPLGIYNTSIQLIGARLLRVLRALPSGALLLPNQILERMEAELAELYDAFLDALMEHMDDVKRVLLCFRKADGTSNTFRLPYLGERWHRQLRPDVRVSLHRRDSNASLD